jgi:hypothetical protein
VHKRTEKKWLFALVVKLQFYTSHNAGKHWLQKGSFKQTLNTALCSLQTGAPCSVYRVPH